MPRHKKVIAPEPIEELPPIVEDSVEEAAIPEAPEAPKEPEMPEAPEEKVENVADAQVSVDIVIESAWSVFSIDKKFVRTYSLEDHGPEAHALAVQFAQKISGSVQAV